MSPLGAILLLWLAVSLSVYGYRIYRRVTQGPKDVREGRADPSGSPASASKSSPGTGAASRLIENPLPGSDAETAESDTTNLPPATAPSSSGTDADTPAPLDPSPPPTPSDPPTTIPPTPLRTESPRRGKRVPIAEAVAGIVMPCDLSPLLGDTTLLNPLDVAFFTTTFDADHVRGGLVAELVRLGFDVSPSSASRIVATRDSVEIVVTVHADPATVQEGGYPVFPTASPDSVVARFQS